MAHSEGDAGPATTGLLRQIPAVNELLGRTALRDLQARAGRRLVVREHAPGSPASPGSDR